MSEDREYKEIGDLPGLGPKSVSMLKTVGIHSLHEFMQQDPFEVYAKLKAMDSTVSLNLLYALMGAQELKSWKDIAQTRRTEILLRLDDMGIAP